MIKADFELSTGNIVYYMCDNVIYKGFISDKIVHYKREKGKSKKRNIVDEINAGQ